ncbi:MAG TPA: response regulator [Chryseosolibacter sp.]
MSTPLAMAILYIDDDPDDRETFVEAVRSVDPAIQCETVTDGLEALSYLELNKLPDLIVLDINMPLMNGITCLAEIKGNAETSHIPVIIFTTSDSRSEMNECKKLGAYRCVVKPSTYAEMKIKIASLLNDKLFA